MINNPDKADRIINQLLKKVFKTENLDIFQYDKSTIKHDWE